MSQDTINIELTLDQFNHVKNILAQSKPSRTRLTREEKNFIIYVLEGFLEDHPYSDESGMLDTIKKKLQ
jgi:hypothetical protein